MMTLKNISDETGFSVSTISKALNDKHDINEETKKIIQDFATKANYRPNKNALALRSKRSSIVAIIVPRVNNSVYSEMLYYTQKCASNSGFRVMLFQSFDEVSKIQFFLEDLNDGSVDAAIVFTKYIKDVSKINLVSLKNIIVDFVELTQDQNPTAMQNTCNELFQKIKKYHNSNLY